MTKLKFEPIEVTAKTAHGLYYLTLVDQTWWAADFLPHNESQVFGLANEDGDDWDTYEKAVAACEKHAETYAPQKAVG